METYRLKKLRQKDLSAKPGLAPRQEPISKNKSKKDFVFLDVFLCLLLKAMKLLCAVQTGNLCLSNAELQG